MSQIVERFEAAVQSLVGDGPIKNRLLTAYCENLEDLQHVDLPVPGNIDFGELHSALHRSDPVGKSDCVRVSVQKMSPTEAWWHAQTIVRLYTEVLALEQQAEQAAEASLEPVAEEPPRFLVSHR